MAGLHGTQLPGRQAWDLLPAQATGEDVPDGATFRRPRRRLCGPQRRPFLEPWIRFFLCSF